MGRITKKGRLGLGIHLVFTFPHWSQQSKEGLREMTWHPVRPWGARGQCLVSSPWEPVARTVHLLVLSPHTKARP